MTALADAGQPRDLTAERHFIEGLLCERFNFLLVFFSLVVAGALQTDRPLTFAVVLALGALICTLLAAAIARAQLKLDLILAQLKIHCPTDPAAREDEWAKDAALLADAKVPRYAKRMVSRSRRRLIGYFIPLVCYVSLWAGAVAAAAGWLKP